MATKNSKATSRTPSRAPAGRGTAPVVETSGREVGPTNDLLKMMEQDAGRGVSTASEDNIVPLLYVLQKGSPQCDRDDQAHIKGAKPGDFWIRGTQVVVDSEEDGLEFVPCHFSKCWLQWRANRGGFAGKHATRPKDARQVPDAKKPEKLVWRMPDAKGEYNDACDAVVETREYAGIITSLEKPVSLVIPFSSTGHTPAREWMGLINRKLIPDTDKPAPIYAYKYHLSTIRRENDDGTWYQIAVTDAGEKNGKAVPKIVDDVELFRAARKINADFESGALRADTADDTDDLAAGENDDM